jgi:hypothetical protein
MEACDDALLYRVMSHVDCGLSLARLRRVSKRFRRIADSEELWRRLCVERFNVAPDSKPPATWADVYRWEQQPQGSLVPYQGAAR